MASVGTFLTIISGIMILFYLGGLDVPTSTIIGTFQEHFSDFSLSNFFTSMEGIVSGLLVGGLIFAGIRSGVEGVRITLTAGYASLLLIGFGADIVSINLFLHEQGMAFVAMIADLLLIPLGVLGAHSVMTWWSGGVD